MIQRCPRVCTQRSGCRVRVPLALASPDEPRHHPLRLPPYALVRLESPIALSGTLASLAQLFSAWSHHTGKALWANHLAQQGASKRLFDEPLLEAVPDFERRFSLVRPGSGEAPPFPATSEATTRRTLRISFSGWTARLSTSCLVCSQRPPSRFPSNQQTCVLPRPGGKWKKRSVDSMTFCRQHTDPPNMRFKLAVCLYAMGQGGHTKLIADAASVGKSIVSGSWLSGPADERPRNARVGAPHVVVGGGVANPRGTGGTNHHPPRGAGRGPDRDCLSIESGPECGCVTRSHEIWMPLGFLTNILESSECLQKKRTL